MALSGMTGFARTEGALGAWTWAVEARSVNGFEYVGGEAGWQLAQHKYEFVNGRLAMSDECDHAIRKAEAATPADLERARQQGGA